MKKFKLLFSILMISTLLVGCSLIERITGPVETDIETINETIIETIEETEAETIQETEEETVVETETEIETVAETVAETQAEEVISVQNDSGNGPDSSVDLVVNNSNEDLLNNQMTNEMKSYLENYIVTLIEDDRHIMDDFPKENLQAIAKYENSDSIGYVVRYAQNKIGLAQYYKESTTGVFVLFNGESLLERSPLIANDSAEEYKNIAQEIIATQVVGEAQIEYAY